MRRSLSWIDDDDLRAALERAGAGTPPQPRTVAVRRAAASGSAEVQPLAESDTPSGQGTGRTTTPFSPPSGSLQTRLKALFAWIIEQTGCRRIFVVDDEGLVLMEKGADPDLVAISSSFLSAYDRVQASLETEAQRSMAVDLESGHVLHLIGADTALGRHALGFVVTTAVKRAVVSALRDGLRETLDTPA